MKRVLPFLFLTFFVTLIARGQFAQKADNSMALSLLNSNLDAIGISEIELKNTLINTSYEDASSGIRYTYLQQTYKGIPIDKQILILTFRQGKLLSKSGSLNPSAEKIANIKSGIPSLSAITAVGAALADKGFSPSEGARVITTNTNASELEFNTMGVSRENITAKLMWTPVEEMIDGKLRQTELKLSWQVYFIPKTNSDYWLLNIDAATGKVIAEDNLTDYDNFGDVHQQQPIGSTIPQNKIGQSSNQFFKLFNNNKDTKIANSPSIVNGATYRVVPFPAESPWAPGGSFALRTDPWTAAPGNATTLKWHTGASGTDYTYTRGNNVWAYEDRTAPANTGTQAKSAQSSTSPDPLTFNFIPDTTVNPIQNSPIQNQQFNITNLFYWNNIIHDVMYQYGFNEVSGNFQDDNLGRGGVGNDHVNGEAQDASGTNNANFSTPADGGSGRMQMYLWNLGGASPNKDGDVDNGIVVHEFGHGISNRLTGGPAATNCLNNAEQMGEGWSDYYALMFTQDWASAIVNTGFNSPRGIGLYALNGSNLFPSPPGTGIRHFKYCTNFAVNSQVYLASLPSSPHDRGEIWCSALWEMTWEIIKSTGTIEPNIYNASSLAGNIVALKLVTEGLKLQQCSPGFISGRNAIIQADQNLYAGAHICAIRKAFARRGMGDLASEGSTSSINDQVVDFTNGVAALSMTQNGAAGIPEGQNIVYTHTLSANLCDPIVNYTLRDTLPANVTFVSAPGGTYNNTTRVVSWPVNLATGSSVVYTLTVNINAGSYFPPLILIDEPVASTTISPFWTPASTTANVWVAHNLRSKSAPNSFFTPNAAIVSDQTLATTASFAMGATPPVLSFWHQYQTESTFDGGVLEISLNGGTTWSDIGETNMVQNPYNATLSAAFINPLAGRRAWSGSVGTFVETRVNMLPYANQANVKLRWRLGSDNSVAATGWNVDDINLKTVAVVNLRSSLFNASSIRESFVDTVTVILPPVGGGIPVATATPATQTVCTGTAITTIVLTSDQPATTYAWTRNNVATVTGIAASGSGDISGTLVNTTALPVTVTFTIIPTAGGNTGAAITATVTVNPGLIVDQPANQTVCNGANTLPVNFTGSANTNFNWTNNTTSIGLAASGSGNIAAFAAINSGNAPVVATISVTPVPAAATFTNTTPILIPGTGTSGPGGPYPSNISVSGITGTISKVTVKLNGLNHTFPDDIDILLVGPAGQNAIIMSDVGGGGDAVNLTFTLDDDATASLPDNTQLLAGSFKPTNILAGDAFAAPAPAPSGNVPLNIFNGTNANGTWSLYIVDDASGDIGSLAGGWELSIFTASAACPATPKDFTITVNPTPVVDPVTSQTLCSGATTTAINFTSPTTGGTITYNWTNSDPSIGLAASGSGNIPAFITTNATAAVVTATIIVTPSYTNGGTACAGTPITFTITVNPSASVNQPANQTVCNNTATLPVNFTGTANTTFNWTNTTPSIGLAANGVGNIASFTGTNATNAPVTGTVTVTPVFLGGGGPVTTTFTSTTVVDIPALPTTSGIASPYPTNIVVTGLSSPITKVTVKLNGLNHTFPDDIDIMLVGPGGQNAIILSDVGSATDAVGLNIILDDAAAASLPDLGPLVSGTFKPTNIGAVDPFAAPAPAPSGNVPLNIFNGTAANGTWSLYIVDDLGGDFGNLTGGWELNITTSAPAACPGTPKTFTITVNPTPVVNAPANQTVCNGANSAAVNFSSPTSGGTLSYSWTNNNTSIGLGANGTGNIPVFAAINTGTAPVTATISVTPSYTNGGTTCAGVPVTFSITVNPTPTVNVVANQTVCQGQPTAAVIFSGAVTGTTYTWVNNNTATGLGASGTGNIPSFIATNTTTAPITSTITVTPNFGTSPNICSGTPRTFTITVNPLPVITCPGNITMTSTLGLCTAPVTYATTVTGTPTPTVTYTFTGATTGSGSGNGSGSLFNVGVTTVTVIATNSCASSNCSFTITINDAQAPSITSQPVSKTVCEGTTATFSVTATNALTYQWERYNGTAWVAISGATSATLTFTNAGTDLNANSYRVKVQGLCTFVYSNYATLSVNPKPTVSIVSTQTVLVPGSGFTLTAITNGTGGTYVWYKNGVIVPGVTGNILTGGRIDDRATYKVTYTNQNGCVNTSADFVIGTLQTTTIFVYPNPSNGQFQIRFYNIPNEKATVYIYNAAGQIVFKQNIPTGSLPYSQMPVNISNMAAGFYVIKLINGAGQELGNTKIIKQ